MDRWVKEGKGREGEGGVVVGARRWWSGLCAYIFYIFMCQRYPLRLPITPTLFGFHLSFYWSIPDFLRSLKKKLQGCCCCCISFDLDRMHVCMYALVLWLSWSNQTFPSHHMKEFRSPPSSWLHPWSPMSWLLNNALLSCFLKLLTLGLL